MKYLLLSVFAGALGLVFSCGVGAEPSSFAPPQLALKTEDGFSVPQANPVFRFPRDHGAHRDFKVEWWYVTGHCFGPSGERYGFQATFFRRAVGPFDPAAGAAAGAFRKDEVFLFHAAILDVRTGRFIHSEELARAGWNAGAEEARLSVFLGEARLQQPDLNLESFQLDAKVGRDSGFSFAMEPLKPLVAFGENGVSRKGNSPTAASWYLTFPRLKISGSLRVGGRLVAVQGEAWMDHEISSSQLASDQAGWDWAGIQLEDGREVMVYRLRRQDGSMDPASALSWVGRGGGAKHCSADHFQWESSGKWKGPRSGAEYPLPVRLKTTDPDSGKPVEWLLEPLFAAQELEGAVSGVPYWEGACRVMQEGRSVGSAYVELTGYAGALGRALR
jgi:predicted secreted hydrolase